MHCYVGHSINVGIDQATFQEALQLTIIGVSTAFTLLVVLALIVMIVGKFAREQPAPAAKQAAAPPDAREKALAAAIAVSVLLERQRSVDPASPSVS